MTEIKNAKPRKKRKSIYDKPAEFPPEEIRRIMKKCGMDSKGVDLTELLGLSPVTVPKWLKNKARPRGPSVIKLRELQRANDGSPKEVIDYSANTLPKSTSLSTRRVRRNVPGHVQAAQSHNALLNMRVQKDYGRALDEVLSTGIQLFDLGDIEKERLEAFFKYLQIGITNTARQYNQLK